MSDAQALGAILEHGYLAAFLAVWIGIWATPIPDEAVVMSVGFASARGALAPVPAFALAYLGMASALSAGYVAGRLVGAPLLERLASRPRLQRPLAWARKLVARFGSAALVISYGVPVVRLLVPHLVGVGRMPFARYALCSYSTGAVWTLAYFLAGRTVGRHSGELAQVAARAPDGAVTALAALGALVFLCWLTVRLCAPKGRGV
jgi:membrane-associated protein